MGNVALRINAIQRRDLMEIVEDRYQTGSTLIASQLPVTAWQDVFDEPTFADAILDRLIHNAYRLEFEGQSFRKQDTKMVSARRACTAGRLPF